MQRLAYQAVLVLKLKMDGSNLPLKLLRQSINMPLSIRCQQMGHVLVSVILLVAQRLRI